MNIYSIDTNMLISWSRFNPISYNRIFWSSLKKFIDKGQIILIKPIADECKYGKLKTWIKSNAKITEISVDVRKRAIEINNKYGLITNENGTVKSGADPFLIAYAERYECTVLSDESNRKNKNDPMKIPDVCAELRIKLTRSTEEMMKKLDFPKG